MVFVDGQRKEAGQRDAKKRRETKREALINKKAFLGPPRRLVHCAYANSRGCEWVKTPQARRTRRNKLLASVSKGKKSIAPERLFPVAGPASSAFLDEIQSANRGDETKQVPDRKPGSGSGLNIRYIRGKGRKPFLFLLGG